MHIVVGSGPAGIAAARALLQRNRKVLMLDTALEPEAEVYDRQRELVHEGGSQLLRVAPRSRTAEGIPEKRYFGSDFALRWIDRNTEVAYDGVSPCASFARGGLSRIWGANLLALPASEFRNWPFLRSELEPFYREILEYVPRAAPAPMAQDRFYDDWPRSTPLGLSDQARLVLEAFGRAKESLLADGLAIEAAHHAVHTKSCSLCGLCLSGCPWDLIYSSNQTLENLLLDPRFMYRSGVMVRTLRHENDRIYVHGLDLETGEMLQFEGSRIFLGAGALNTSKILLESAGIFDTSLMVRENQYFLAPFFQARSGPRTPNALEHSLSQVMFSLQQPETANLVHLLLYPSTLYLQSAIRNRFPAWLANLKVLDAVVPHISILQGYLHSDDSNSIELSLSRIDARHCKLSLKSWQNSVSTHIVSSTLSKIRRLSWKIKALVPLFSAVHGTTGKSYHLGAVLPMRKNPSGMSSDLLGRPLGLERVHIVDATCLPSIPAPNITFTTMANATRIVDAICRSDFG